MINEIFSKLEINKHLNTLEELAAVPLLGNSQQRSTTENAHPFVLAILLPKLHQLHEQVRVSTLHDVPAAFFETGETI